MPVGPHLEQGSWQPCLLTSPNEQPMGSVLLSPRPPRCWCDVGGKAQFGLHEPSVVRTELRLQRPVLSGARVQRYPKACPLQLDLLLEAQSAWRRTSHRAVATVGTKDVIFQGLSVHFWNVALRIDSSLYKGTSDWRTSSMTSPTCISTRRPTWSSSWPASRRRWPTRPTSARGTSRCLSFPHQSSRGPFQPFIHLTNQYITPNPGRISGTEGQTFNLYPVDPSSSCYRL